MTPTPTSAVQLALMVTAIGLAPALVLSCTTFARFVIVFTFLKTGLGASGTPPGQILVGLSLFMTAFVMAPIASAIDEAALTPYLAGRLDERGALEVAAPPLRDFLVARTAEHDLELFFDVGRLPRPNTVEDVPLRVALPAFAISELRTAFQMGVVILLPFLVIDLIVASVLSSLGMVMLPPAVVALPLKLLVFVAVDGWHLVVRSLIQGAI